MTLIQLCTIISKPEIALARALARSVAEHAPQASLTVLLADRPDGFFDPADEPYDLLSLDELADPAIAGMRMRYERLAFCYALTPILLRHLLRKGAPMAVFLKQESLLTGDLTPTLAAMARHAISLTPHRRTGQRGVGAIEADRTILLSGVNNAGLVGVTDRPQALQFLDWWRDRLIGHCRHDIAQGMHFEQRWLDLAHGYFDDLHVIRDPGVNLGHWNVRDSRLGEQDDQVVIDAAPVRLARFSGYDVDQPGQATRYKTDLPVSDLGCAARLWYRYHRYLAEANHAVTRYWPYAYDRFDNHVPVTPAIRAIYRDLGEAGDGFADPHATARPGSFFAWLNQPVSSPAAPVARTRLWDRIYRSRPDLQQHFPEIDGKDASGFASWAQTTGQFRHDIPHAFAMGWPPPAGAGL